MPLASASRRRTRRFSSPRSTRAAPGPVPASSLRLSSSHCRQARRPAALTRAKAAVSATAKGRGVERSIMSAVPQLLDLALERAVLVGRDPLEHLDPFLERPYLLAHPQRLRRIRGLAAAIFEARLEDARDHHDDDDAEDEFILVH